MRRRGGGGGGGGREGGSAGGGGGGGDPAECVACVVGVWSVGQRGEQKGMLRDPASLRECSKGVRGAPADR